MTEVNVATSTKIDSYQEAALEVLQIEAAAILGLRPHIKQSFSKAAKLLQNCSGRVVVSGIGKSGHIGRKIAATLASTGTPSFFLHPSEALHGDLGMVTSNDVMLVISNSGNNAELLSIIPYCKRYHIPVIAMCSNPTAKLAKLADIFLNIGVEQEACPLGLAPTASTTATLAMGDALAVSILKARNFQKEDFAKTHPGGKLGKQLTTRVTDVMHHGEKIPQVTSGTLLRDAILEISNKRLGFTTVVAKNSKKIVGIFTDGDIRRSLNNNLDINCTIIDDVMTTNFAKVLASDLAVDAAKILTEKFITGLPVLDADGTVVGACNIHDFFQAGVI